MAHVLPALNSAANMPWSPAAMTGRTRYFGGGAASTLANSAARLSTGSGLNVRR